MSRHPVALVGPTRRKAKAHWEKSVGRAAETIPSEDGLAKTGLAKHGHEAKIGNGLFRSIMGALGYGRKRCEEQAGMRLP